MNAGRVDPGMLLKVETVVTASLNKNDLDPRYDPRTKEFNHGNYDFAE